MIKELLHRFGYEIRKVTHEDEVKTRPTGEIKVHYKRHCIDWNQKLLCVTHTDRPVQPDRCDLNFLEQRYSDPDRFPPTEPFETLLPSFQYSGMEYSGTVTVWEFIKGDFRKPRLLAYIRPTDYKPQFAIWYKQRLWILGLEILEVYNSDLSRIAVIEDPWLSGTHTIIPDQCGHLIVSCSASDSVLVIDEETYKVVQALRMPEKLYGVNYSLSRTDSLVEHYIHNDYQLTHINCAWPWRGGILVSTLIQGAIGWFDENQNYKELLRGFVGCHGVRTDHRTNQIYFCDSCLGTVVFLKSDFTIEHRINTGSIWLHDTHQLNHDTFALSIADRNQIEIMNCFSRDIITVIGCSDFGNSTQFVYYGE